MSKLATKSIAIEIILHDPPKYTKYSPINRVVSGEISIHCKEALKNVCAIKYGVSGKAELLRYIETTRGNPLQVLTPKPVPLTETKVFYQNSLKLDLDEFNKNNEFEIAAKDKTSNPDNMMYTLPEGKKLNFKFRFELPDNKHLPSSSKGYSDVYSGITIDYQVFIEIYRVGGLLGKVPRISLSTSIPIYYQSGAACVSSKRLKVLRYTDTELFVNKVKKFYYDKEKNALIPSSLDKAHTKTKFIRQFWDNNYKQENYKSATKTIPLTVDFQTKTYIDMSLPLSSQFKLILKSDLQSADIPSNQGLDFVFNNQSTKLGLFQIESLHVEAYHGTNFLCKNIISYVNYSQDVMKISFKDLFFDVKDFTYDKSQSVYKFEIPVEQMVASASLNMNESLVNLLGSKTILCSGVVSNWYSHVCQMKFTWKISDGMFHKKKFVFGSEPTLDFFVDQSPANYVNPESQNFVAPPVYDTDQKDETLPLFDEENEMTT